VLLFIGFVLFGTVIGGWILRLVFGISNEALPPSTLGDTDTS
jgi:hypothetical protein